MPLTDEEKKKMEEGMVQNCRNGVSTPIVRRGKVLKKNYNFKRHLSSSNFI
jgi:hypothetical protein